MTNKAFIAWFQSFQQQALALNERRLIVLAGDELWAQSLLNSADIIETENKDKPRSFIYSDSPAIKANMSLQRFRDKLGSESDYVVFMHKLLPIDVIAALSGTLVSGGIFILVVKNLHELESSLFYQRFLTLVAASTNHAVIEQDNFILPALSSTQDVKTLLPHSDEHPFACVTNEQVTAVNAILKVALGKRKRPLVLTADRGRGKSSALAIASAQLLKNASKDNPLVIVVTAADINSLTVFFNQLRISLPEGCFDNNCFTYKNGIVEFIAIDQLIKHEVKASLILVDEAAAIPVYQLEEIVKCYHRLVFSSTVHGYEGAGRGFTIKFQQRLEVLCPKWKSLHVHQPIRYRQDDPLEQLIFTACLLNAELTDLSGSIDKGREGAISALTQVDINTLEFQKINAEMLVADEELLAQVVSILVTAHYQTKPSDIKMLLDNTQVTLVCLFAVINNKRIVVAVAMLMHEGQSGDVPIPSEDICDVINSRKRLTNQFTPQSLLTHCGVESAFSFHYVRVVRIAVHVSLQQQGIGGMFLTKIAKFAQNQGADFLSSSFGAMQSLLSFWLKDDFHLARLGFSKDKASGEHSALVLKALNDESTTLTASINTEFYRSFDFLLNDEYQYLAAELIALIVHYCPKDQLDKLTEHDKANVAAFIHGQRQYACCVFSLFLWLKSQLTEDNYTEKGVTVLIERIMQKQSIKEVCEQHNFTGKKALEHHIKMTINAIIDDKHL